MKVRVLYVVFFVCFCGTVYGQKKEDSLQFLMADIVIQDELTTALNQMYNFDFAPAEQQFRWLKQKYPWHPLPYFMLGLAQFWKVMPEFEDRSHDEELAAAMDSAIFVGKEVYQHNPTYKIEAAFLLAAAHGFKGYLYSDESRKNWTKAAFEGKAALRYMAECSQKNYLSVELLFGDALYNYFSVWIPENYPILKPVLWFFRKGNKKLGLKQLKEVSTNAFYTRVEAMVWRMRVLSGYENDYENAFQIAEYLHKTFPQNPFFHRYYARMLYYRGMSDELEKNCVQILQKIDSAVAGYGPTAGRYAAFFMGHLYENRGNKSLAKMYYLKTVNFTLRNKAVTSGYYLHALFVLSDIFKAEGNMKMSELCLRSIKENAEHKDVVYKTAKERLKKSKKNK